jgi:hypothetical protein
VVRWWGCRLDHGWPTDDGRGWRGRVSEERWKSKKTAEELEAEQCMAARGWRREVGDGGGRAFPLSRVPPIARLVTQQGGPIQKRSRRVAYDYFEYTKAISEGLT